MLTAQIQSPFRLFLDITLSQCVYRGTEHPKNHPKTRFSIAPQAIQRCCLPIKVHTTRKPHSSLILQNFCQEGEVSKTSCMCDSFTSVYFIGQYEVV